jgi:hypothetical protein
MADETKNTSQEAQKPEFEVTELAEDDLDNVSGGLTERLVDGCEGCDGCGTCMN